MQFIKLASVADFDGVRIRSYRILGKFVAIVKNKGGSFYATEIGCKHNNADLTQGWFKGDIVTCHRHGWRYNIQTGECLNQSSAPLRRHALKIEQGDIYVSVSPIEVDENESPDDVFPEIQFRNRSD